MKPLLPMNNNLKNKIQTYIKEGLDISDLIDGYCIRGMQLNGAIIKRATRIQEDLSNTQFIRCVFGDAENQNSVCNFSGSNFNGSNFSHSKFLGPVWFRSCDLRNTNFSYASVPNVDYQYADLTNINLCETTFRIGSKSGLGAKLNWSTFEKLAQYLQLNMTK